MAGSVKCRNQREAGSVGTRDTVQRGKRRRRGVLLQEKGRTGGKRSARAGRCVQGERRPVLGEEGERGVVKGCEGREKGREGTSRRRRRDKRKSRESNLGGGRMPAFW